MTLSVMLLERNLLRGAGSQRVHHPQHPRCFLVGRRNHDDCRVWRRGAIWLELVGFVVSRLLVGFVTYRTLGVIGVGQVG